MLKLEGISASDVSVTRDGYDMLLTIAESSPGAGDSGSVRLYSQAAGDNFSGGVEWVEFADGSRWGQQTLRELMFAAAVTDGNDDIIGSNFNDVLRGGKGDDYLAGGSGSDTYLYTRGDGNDAIYEPSNAGSNDLLKLEGISASDVSVTRDGYDMLLTIAESSPGAGDGGSVRLYEQALGDRFNTGIEQIEFADGTHWDKAMLNEQLTLSSSPDMIDLPVPLLVEDNTPDIIVVGVTSASADLFAA